MLRPACHFVFTTHGRDSPNFAEFWREERDKWDRGEQDNRLIEFGDRIIIDSGHPTYIHIPTRDEVRGLIAEAGLMFVDGRPRSDVSVESDAVQWFTPECVMWIARAPSDHE